MPRNAALNWERVQRNPTYFQDALSDERGLGIRWHSPDDPTSSQIFCVSAFGAMRSLPDRDRILDTLFRGSFGSAAPAGPWRDNDPRLEYVQKAVLGETGTGMPTNVDAFLESDSDVVCIESKFLHDAKEGFGGCGQAKPQSKSRDFNCAGFHGPESDRKTKTQAHCRLEVPDGRRAARRYWELGRRYFLDSVYRVQSSGEECPFKGSAFQLMRNFLFAATISDGCRRFAVLAIVPSQISVTVRQHVEAFKASILRPEFRDRIAVGTYEELVALLSTSESERGRLLGRFLRDRMNELLGTYAH